jgi:hypothetical protein
MSSIQAIDDFCKMLQKGVAECGGERGFFEKLEEDTPKTLIELVSRSTDQQILKNY